jgi:hypothetical protein
MTQESSSYDAVHCGFGQSDLSGDDTDAVYLADVVLGLSRDRQLLEAGLVFLSRKYICFQTDSIACKSINCANPTYESTEVFRTVRSSRLGLL